MAAIPAHAKVFGKRLSAWDNVMGMQGCAVGQDCSVGCSKLPLDVQHKEQVYSILFQNWSDDRDRVARMVIFFDCNRHWHIDIR